MFFRVLQHLLPDGRAWQMTVDSQLRRFFQGLAAGAPAEARAFIDRVYAQLGPETTESLERWERQHALPSTGSDEMRRARLRAAWQATGGQSPRYLQDILHAAGFDIYIHEWWESGPPYVARDPRRYAELTPIGTTRCGMPDALCGRNSAVCNRWGSRESSYLVNRDLTRVAPEAIPADPSTWPFFVYVAGPVFGERAEVPASRRAELEELLLRLFPAHLWIVLLVRFVDAA